MKKIRFGIKLALFSVILITLSCSKDDTDFIKEQNAVDSNGNSIIVSQLQQGKLVVKVAEDFGEKIEASGSAVKALSVGVKSSDFLGNLGIKRMERLFPDAGKFEKRTREFGLHLWYEVEFDENYPMTKATGNLSSIDGIEVVEFVPKIIIVGNPVVNPFGNDILAGVRESEDSQTLPFDDPKLSTQWHYYNDGTIQNSVAGCDINLFPVWKNYTTGNSEVIVSVVDGGVDFTHEDLKANMWRNPSETGDRVYGYNFIKNGPLITADAHGTHVAGTISAVNNNGLGVCGIAGGDYSKGVQGALIMSCQIFDDTEQTGNGAYAIKWGADHGAVISQNSWGYDKVDYTPEYLKNAVDYFIKYAGFDENDNQVGPMAGGVVIFAAGNDDKEQGYPASYESIIAVSSVGADFKRAYYSNYGDWTDVSAPGADSKKGNLVISTLPGNNYGGMQGTSMACPHVSGIAALVVSYLGGPGFTNTTLRELLEKSCRDISSYNTSKKIAGLIDAHKAISGTSSIAPDRVTDLKLSSKSNTVYYSFSVPKDEDDASASSAVVYYDTEAGNIPDNCSKITVSLGGLEAGSLFEGQLGNLNFQQTYYVAVCAADGAGNLSKLSDIESVEIAANLPPEVNALDGTKISLKAAETVTLRFSVSEPENQKYTFALEPTMNGVSIAAAKDKTLQLTINGPVVAKGLDPDIDHSYDIKLIVTDEYKAFTEVNVSFVILKNNPPVKVSDISNMVFAAVGEVVELDMSNYFNDPDGEQLRYVFNVNPSNVATFSQSGNTVYATAMSYGTTNIVVTALDALEKSVSSSFKILVRNPNNEMDLYPQPATSHFYLRAGNDFTGIVKLYNSLGAKVLEQSISSTPFNPAKIDVSGLSAGTYTMVLSMGDKEIKRNVVKL